MASAAIIISVAVGGLSAGVTFTAGALAFSATNFLIGAALSGLSAVLSGAFAQEPEGPAFSFPSQAENRTQTLREPITPRRRAVGQVILGTKLSYYARDDAKAWHHMVLTVCDGPIAGFGTVWANDEPISAEDLDNDGTVIRGRFANQMRLKFHTGALDQAADSDLIAEVDGLDENFRGRGVAYIYAKVKWTRKALPSGLPGFRVVVNAQASDPRTAVTGFNDNAALAWRDYIADDFLGLAAHGAALTDIASSEFTSAANAADEIADCNDVDAEVEAVDVSGDSLALAGDRLPFFPGDRLELLTDGTAPGGLATATDYYAISVNHARASADSPVRIRLAASLADARAGTAVTITDAGAGTHSIRKTGEPRYRASGMLEASDPPVRHIDDILSAMIGTAVYSGQWILLPATWRAGSVTFDESDLRGAISGPTRHSIRKAYNGVAGVYASHFADGDPDDYPAVKSSTLIAADNGHEQVDRFDQPMTSSPIQAQRNAGIRLKQYRTGEVHFEATFSLRALQARAGETVLIDNARRGWTAKPMMVKSLSLIVERERGSAPYLAVHMALAATASTDYDWDPAVEETDVQPSPRPTGTGVFAVETPTLGTIESGDDHLILKSDGTVVSRILAPWTSVTDELIRAGGEVQVRFRQSGDGDDDWSIRRQDDPTLDFVHLDPVEDGISYDIQIRAINALGVDSDWSATVLHTVVGKTAAPPDALSFTVTRMADGTRRFAWTTDTPLPADVRPGSGGGAAIRYASGAGHGWGDLAALHSGVLSASPYETNELAAGTYTFGLKLVDSTGNESANALIIETTLGDPRLREVLASRDEAQEGWNGTITDGHVNYEGHLEADGETGSPSGTWDDLAADWDSLADSWRGLVANASPLVYESPEIDLGTDLAFTPVVSAEGTGTITLTMQTGTDADGSATGSFVSLGAVSAARYVRIRASIAGTTPYLRSLVTLIDAEAQVEDYEDVDTSAASSGRFERLATGHFKLATRGKTAAIVQAQITALQNVGAGWSWELVSKTTTITGDAEPAAEFKIYDNTGTLADATVDVTIKGPKD